MCVAIALLACARACAGKHVFRFNAAGRLCKCVLCYAMAMLWAELLLCRMQSKRASTKNQMNDLRAAVLFFVGGCVFLFVNKANGC